MVKTDPVQVRLEPEEKAALIKAAEDERRPVSQWIAVAVVERLRRLGYLNPEKSP